MMIHVREGERGSNEKEIFFKVERDTHTDGKGDTEQNRQNVTEKVGRGCSNNLKKINIKVVYRY